MSLALVLRMIAFLAILFGVFTGYDSFGRMRIGAISPIDFLLRAIVLFTIPLALLLFAGRVDARPDGEGARDV